MLKIFLLFISVFISFNKIVQADEIKWYEEEIEKGMVSEKKYRFYKLEKVGEYVRKDLESSYEYEEEENIKYSEYSDWKNQCNNNDGYEVEYGKEYQYQKVRPIHYIKIFNTSNNSVKINNVNIHNDNSLLSYEIYSYSGYLRESNVLQPMGHIMIYFSTSIKLDTLKVSINFNKDSSYEIYLSEDKNFKNLAAYAKGNSIANEFVYNDDYILYDNYSNVFTEYNIDENEFIKILSVKNVCREREILTYRYNLVKEYFDNNYYFNIDDIEDLEEKDKLLLYKDENDYKVYYRYKLENDPDENTEIKLVKTGVEKEYKDYTYLKKYIFYLLILSIILIIYKNMSIEKNN